MHPNALSPL